MRIAAHLRPFGAPDNEGGDVDEDGGAVDLLVPHGAAPGAAEGGVVGMRFHLSICLSAPPPLLVWGGMTVQTPLPSANPNGPVVKPRRPPPLPF